MAGQLNQLPLPLPEVLRPWLTINIEYHVLICHAASCQRALSPGAISRHLRDQHNVSPAVRYQYEQFLQQWQWPYDTQSIRLPPAQSAPQPVIPVHDGFQCQDCHFLSTNRKAVREHVNKKHQKKRLKDEQIFTTVRLQTWFREKRERYWVIDEQAVARVYQAREGQEERRGSRRSSSGSGSSGSGSGSDSESSSGNHDPGVSIKAEVQEWLKREEEEARYEASIIAAESDPWLQYTGWEAELSNMESDLVTIAGFAATATAHEPELEPVLQSWGRIFQRCLHTLTATGDYKDILKWWASPKVEAAHQRPYERLERRTMIRYSQTFARLLCYMIRTAPNSFEDDTATGVTFTKNQWECIKEVQEAAAVAVADDDELDNRLMKLIVNLITQETSQLTMYESPVMHYLAVRGIDPQTSRFYPSYRYTPVLAHMIWIIRLLMLEVAVSESGWPALGLQSRTAIGAVAGAVAVRIHKLRREYLCEGSFSPASSILSQLAFGQKQNRIQPSESNIYWADDRQTVFLDGKGVAVAKVRTMCQALTDELKASLRDLLFHQDVLPLPLPQLVDSMGTAQRFQQNGYSFIDHPDNAQWKVTWEFLWEYMLKDGQSLVKSSGSSSDFTWDTQACKAYLMREKQFLHQLMVAMHLTGGQPARSPEIGSIKVQNSVTSSRNVFVINGRVAVVTTYDKAQKRRGKSEYVFRCFPDQLSQVITQYLVYILPFTRVIQKSKGDFLFADEHGPWIKDQLSVAVAVATTKHLGVRLTTSGWRHVAIAIANEHLRKASRIWKQDQEENDEEGMAVAEESDGEVEQSLFEHILVRQSAHGKKTADLHYAVDGAFLNRLGPDLVNVYSQASRAWHAFLELESKGAAVAVAVAGSQKRAADASQSIAKRPNLERNLAVEGLQKILGPDAQPRSEGQRHALELVHTATAARPQIIVLGTGSGKSLLFFSVAAIVSHQTVIVVVPFAALVQDLVQRARGHGLSCEEWQWQRQWTVLPPLLIVSADRAVEGDFLHFAKGLELNQQLAHVFFDECHVAVTDTSYRAKLRELWQLRYLQCRFTCLTATLLTCLEPVLRTNLLLEHASIYRQSTIRPTIRYRVIDCHPQPMWKVAEPLIRGLPLPLGSRGVIYVRSYAEGERVAEKMDCPFYKATATGKQELLDQWSHGDGGWIVATGALGTGIDIPGIVYILHLGRPYGLTSFMQQAGRGGRAGEISDSIVILPSSGSGSREGHRTFPAARQELVNIYSVEAQDEAALTAFLESTSCRRSLLAQHFDGSLDSTSCTATDSILCDRCHIEAQSAMDPEVPSGGSDNSSGSGSPIPSASDTIHHVLQAQVVDDTQLELFHQQLHPYCIYCMLMLDKKASHYHCDCPHAKDQGCDIERYRQWRSSLKLAPRHQCYRCGLSQSLCRAIEEERPCAYPHLMLPGLFFLHQVNRHLLTICHEVGYNHSEEWQWRWLNVESEGIFGQREVNWMRVWRRVGEIFKGSESS